MTQEHLDKLIAQSGARFILSYDLREASYSINSRRPWGEGGRLEATVIAPGLTCGELGYWAVLHELGHIATYVENPLVPPQQRDQHTARTLWHEAKAWRWAIAHAEHPPSARVRADIAYCMGTYARAAKPGALDSRLANDFRKLRAEMERTP